MIKHDLASELDCKKKKVCSISQDSTFLPSWACPVVRWCLLTLLSNEKDFNKLVRFLVLVEFQDKIITEDNMVFFHSFVPKLWGLHRELIFVIFLLWITTPHITPDRSSISNWLIRCYEIMTQLFWNLISSIKYVP